MPAAIRTLIFDLGRVIVPFDFERGYRAIEKNCPHPAASIPGLIRATGLVEPFERGEVTPRDFVARLSRALDFTGTYDDFCRIWTSVFLPETAIPDSFVAALKKRYPLLLLSNTNAIHFEAVAAAYPILRHFDDVILSYKVGAMKPAPRIYQAAIERAGVAPEECFFTDDIPEYVAGARAVGIDAVLFRDCAQLQRDMAARGISWE